ncbi:hypothetical protein KDA23_04860 [Candidatus Saccharibacteria bacterium]|nr:hypothetical protein [Candidatus Saccharibacteria bacterium]
MKEALAIIGALLILGSPLPYIIDIVKGKTKPNIVTWFTWSLLTGIAAAALFAEGQPRAGQLLVADTAGTLAIVLFGLRHGIAKLDWIDGLLQLGAIVGLVLWLVFNSPMIAIVMTITVDLLATIPTLRHSWSEPDEETTITFVLCAVAALLTLLSLKTYDVSGWIYPVYLLLNNSALAITISHGRRKAASAKE